MPNVPRGNPAGQHFGHALVGGGARLAADPPQPRAGQRADRACALVLAHRQSLLPAADAQQFVTLTQLGADRLGVALPVLARSQVQPGHVHQSLGQQFQRLLAGARNHY